MIKYFIILVIAFVAFLSSCTVNSHVMLKTPKDFVFDSIPDIQVDQYVISPGDQLQFRLYSNGGFSVIDITSGTGGGVNAGAMMRNINVFYLVQNDGMVKLPILGETSIVGKTVREAQAYLEERYSSYYVDPFLQLEVANKKVLVFPGSGNSAQWITLQNNTTTLMEVLAQVGGISANSKANSIKIMRKVEDKDAREVYKVDLSKIDGLPYGDMVILADDIIYVQPNANIAREIIQDISPIISLVSSTLVFYLTLKNFVN
ncbi:MAG: polysaccharide biosynthesis/export family protein [Flavobacteriales bacterium]|nr:polysaccharide biosynthesis/export family protein [Flavobacteriales bacterium]